jgi:hypothetical protein
MNMIYQVLFKLRSVRRPQESKQLTSLHPNMVSILLNMILNCHFLLSFPSFPSTEDLQSAEDTIEANEYNLQKALTVLRGMTWTGMIYNIFAKESPPSDVLGKQHDTLSGKRPALETSVNEKAFTSRVESIPNDGDDEKIMNNLLSAVTELHDIGVQIGEQIDQQNTAIDRIEEKTLRVTDQTLAVTLKASQLTQRASNSNDGLIGTYQFIDQVSGYFLSVSNADLLLVPKEDLSTHFFCFLKENTIYGMQNAKTLKYLCSTVWGPIKSSGTSFGRREECHLSLSGDVTGIYFLQTNWGTGGWLKGSVPADSTNGAISLNTVTSNISDKVGVLLFKPVCVSGTAGTQKGLLGLLKSKVSSSS